MSLLDLKNLWDLFKLSPGFIPVLAFLILFVNRTVVKIKNYSLSIRYEPVPVPLWNKDINLTGVTRIVFKKGGKNNYALGALGNNGEEIEIISGIDQLNARFLEQEIRKYLNIWDVPQLEEKIADEGSQCVIDEDSQKMVGLQEEMKLKNGVTDGESKPLSVMKRLYLESMGEEIRYKWYWFNPIFIPLAFILNMCTFRDIAALNVPIGIFFAILFNSIVIPNLINRSIIEFKDKALSITNSPIPWPGVRISARDVSEIITEKHFLGYILRLILKNGQKLTLFRFLLADEALILKEQIEKELDIQ